MSATFEATHTEIPSPAAPLGVELSVVVPVHNEEPCLHELHRRLTQVLPELAASYEILLVNDGSRDRSLEILRELAASDPAHVRALDLSRNFGHEAASSAGIRAARGNAV